MLRSSEYDEGAGTVPRTEVDSSGWQVHARCRDYDPRTFFEAEEGSDSLNEPSGAAKRICDGCVVRDDCLNYALDADEQFGVWGGLTVRERKQFKWFHYPRNTSRALGNASTSLPR